MGKGKSSIVLLGPEVLAIAAYAWHQSIVAFIGWNRSWRYLHILLLLGIIILLAAGLPLLLRFAAAITARRFDAPSPTIFRSLVFSLSPFLFLSLIFLPYVFFLRDIRGYLLPVSLLASAYLIFIFFSRLTTACHQNPAPSLFQAQPKSTAIPPPAPSQAPTRPTAVSPSSLPRWLFALSLLINITLASGIVFPPQPFTGDEPHYLLVTHSILKDGDINLYNNYRDKDYLEFYPGELEPHAYTGRKGDRFQYSKHFPGLPVLLVPAYFVGARVSKNITAGPNEVQLKRRVLIFYSRLPLCLFTALLGILFFLVVLDVTQRRDVSLLAWVFFCFTTPIFFYSHLLYPEILAALLTLYVVRHLILKRPGSAWVLFVSGASIGLLPWFGIKYLVLAAILFLASAVALFGKGKLHHARAMALAFLSPIFISAASFLLFLWVLYGNFSLGSVYRGVSSSASAGLAQASTSVPEPPVQFLSEAVRRFLGFFIDQQYGLFIYSPVFLLGIAGFYFFYKKRKQEAQLLMALLVLYVLFSAAFYWGGHCPPPRPLIPVLGIWGLFMAAALAEGSSRFRLSLTTLLAFLSFLIVWGALRDSSILYPDRHARFLGGEYLYSKLFQNLSNSFVPIHTWMPSLAWDGPLIWLPIVFWAAAFALLTVIFIRKTRDVSSQPSSIKSRTSKPTSRNISSSQLTSRKDQSSSPAPASLSMSAQACVVLALCAMVLLYAFFDVHVDQGEAFAGQDYTLYFQDDHHFGKEVGGFWTQGGRAATVILKSPRPLSAIHVHLKSSVEGEAEVRVGAHTKTVTRTEQTGLARQATFTLPRGFPMRDGHFYTITIKDSTGFVPYRLDRNITDIRYLGVFVRIETR